LLHLLAQTFQALQSLFHVRLLGGLAELDLELVDRGLQRLLAVLDGALHLAANIRRDATFGLPKSLPAGSNCAADKA
jgi:hypothetical protein